MDFSFLRRLFGCIARKLRIEAFKNIQFGSQTTVTTINHFQIIISNEQSNSHLPINGKEQIEDVLILKQLDNEFKAPKNESSLDKRE